MSESVDLNAMVLDYLQTHLGLNQQSTELYGVNVAYFRTLPHKNSSDVIFMEHTLYNVEDCPVDVKLMFSDTSYAAGDYGVQLFQMGYNIPLEATIDVMSWRESFPEDALPQENDIIYIPLLHKLYEVTSTTKIYGFMEQLTGFKIALGKYNPKTSRREGDNLADTISQYTTGLEELFGESISEEVADIVNDNQTSGYTSTEMDDYKFVYDASNIRAYDLYANSNLVNKNYYNLTSGSKNNIAVEYKTGDKFNSAYDQRGYSVWMKTSSYQDSTVKKISKVDSEIIDGIKYTILSVELSSLDIKILNGSRVGLSRGDNINLSGIVSSKNNNILTIRVLYSDDLKLSAKVQNWHLQRGFKFFTGNNVSLLSGTTDRYDGFSINVENGQQISMHINDDIINIPLGLNLRPNTWYGIFIVYGTENKIYIHELGIGFNLLKVIPFTIPIIDVNISRFYIKNLKGHDNNIAITNIRLYDLKNGITQSAIHEDLQTYLIKNNSQTIINDSIQDKLNSFYSGQPR